VIVCAEVYVEKELDSGDYFEGIPMNLAVAEERR
jgi:hypothetical protein